MKNLITICFLFFISLSLSAQSTKLSITGGPQFAILNAPLSEIRSSTFAFSDSTGSFFRETILDVSHKYSTELGYNLGLQFQKVIASKLAIETGLNFNYISFTPKMNFGNSRLVPNGELIFFPKKENNNVGTFGSECTNFVLLGNASNASFNQNLNRIISLQIPLNFEFEFIKETVFLRIGGFFQTPIFTQVKIIKSTFDKTTETTASGEKRTICTSTRNFYNDRSGDGFSNAQFGLHGGIRYQLFKKLSLMIDFQNGFNSIYNKKSHQRYGQAKLKTLSLKLRYNFLKKNKISD